MTHFRLFKFVTVLVATGTIFFLPAQSLAAGSASLSLSPASGTENINSTFTVGVYENGDNVSAVTADMSYDQLALSLVSAACGGAFSSTIQASGSGGSGTLSCYTPPGSVVVSGNQEVGTVSFKALAGSGSASLTFGSGSEIANNGTNLWNGSTAGGNYTLVTPASTPASTGGKGGGTTTTTTPQSAATPFSSPSTT